MGLLSNLFNKAATGIKTLISNAQIGKAATAAGYVQGGTVTQTTSAAKQNQLLMPFAIGGGVLLLLLLFLVSMFKGK